MFETQYLFCDHGRSQHQRRLRLTYTIGRMVCLVRIPDQGLPFVCPACNFEDVHPRVVRNHIESCCSGDLYHLQVMDSLSMQQKGMFVAWKQRKGSGPKKRTARRSVAGRRRNSSSHSRTLPTPATLFVPSEAFGHPAASSGDNQALTCCTPAVGDNGPVTFPMSNESMETFVGSSEAPELDFMMQNINISDLFAPDDYSDLSPQEVSRIIVYPT